MTFTQNESHTSLMNNAASVTEEGGHCREVADVERLKKERMYGLSAKKKAVLARWPLVGVRL